MAGQQSLMPTSLLLLLLLLAFVVVTVDGVMISVNNGEGRALPWGEIESCPPGSKAIGYDTRNDQVIISLRPLPF